jgi:hypothetical protein
MANVPVTLFASRALPGTVSPAMVLPIVSEKTKGTGYYGSRDGLHTVQYTTEGGFIGHIKMQATLVQDPAESDWFDIGAFTEIGDGVNPIPDGAVVKNFAGNFVWARAVITEFNRGSINRVLFQHN